MRRRAASAARVRPPTRRRRAEPPALGRMQAPPCSLRSWFSWVRFYRPHAPASARLDRDEHVVGRRYFRRRPLSVSTSSCSDFSSGLFSESPPRLRVAPNHVPSAPMNRLCQLLPRCSGPSVRRAADTRAAPRSAVDGVDGSEARRRSLSATLHATTRPGCPRSARGRRKSGWQTPSPVYPGGGGARSPRRRAAPPPLGRRKCTIRSPSSPTRQVGRRTPSPCVVIAHAPARPDPSW